MDVMTALGAGALAGLALVVPVGAIGVLLVEEGSSRGVRGGLPAAAAVATVDLGYCLVAVSAGAVVAPVLRSWGPALRTLGGLVLVATGVVGLVRAARGPTGVSPADGTPGSGRRRYALFVALTCVNPGTLVYFAAVAAGLAPVLTSWPATSSFALGVAIASLGWQSVLVVAGASLRRAADGRMTRVTSVIGGGTVAVLGLLLAAGLTPS